jgi:hypothetical protein
VTLYDLRTAARVVSFGCDAAMPGGPPAERWDDVPAVSDAYAPARDRILPHLDRLVSELAGAR